MHTPMTLRGITFKGTFEPDGTGTYRIIHGITKPDAVFIVTACNAHGDLIKALTELRRVCPYKDSNEVTQALEEARQILTKAGVKV